MPFAIHSPKVKTYQETDRTWTAVLFIEGVWYGSVKGFATQSAARVAVRRRYL